MSRVAALAATLVTLAALAAGAPAAAQEAANPAPAVQTDEPPTSGEDDPCEDPEVWEWSACRMRDGVRDTVGGLITAGAANVFDQMYEWMATGAVWLMEQLVALIDGSTAPDVGAGWFAGQYRLMGSLAVALVMPLLMVATLVAVVRQDWRGLLKSYFVYVPAAMLSTAIAIPLVDRALVITDWMSALFLDGLREDIHAFTATVAQALTVGTAATGGAAAPAASSVMLLGAAVIALAAFAVWVELVLRAAGIYVALFFLPLGFAALVWPSTRKWCARLVKALAALILSKFVIVAVIALAAAALGNMGGPDGAGFAGVVAGSTLMLMAAFSPLVLFRLADVAGDELAGAVEGVTQHRTSPVPTPHPQQTAARTYGRIMQARVAADGAGGGMTAGKAASAGGTTAAAAGGAAAATGGAAVAVDAGVKAVKAPATAGKAAGGRLDATATSNGSATPAGDTSSAPASPPPRPVGARPHSGGERPLPPAAPHPADSPAGPPRSADRADRSPPTPPAPAPPTSAPTPPAAARDPAPRPSRPPLFDRPDPPRQPPSSPSPPRPEQE